MEIVEESKSTRLQALERHIARVRRRVARYALRYRKL